MARRVFAVVLDEPDVTTWNRLQERYGEDFLRLNAQTAFVRTKEADPSTVAVDAAITKYVEESSAADGFVIEVSPSTSSGFTFQSVWKWLRDAKKDPS